MIGILRVPIGRPLELVTRLSEPTWKVPGLRSKRFRAYQDSLNAITIVRRTYREADIGP